MRPGRNHAHALPRAELTRSQRDDMHRLLAIHFAGVDRIQFDRDLDEKNWVILVHEGSRLVGFSTLLAYESFFRAEPVSVVYSGDTIMAPEAWGSTVLPRAWIHTVNSLRLTYQRGPLYWLLLTSGYRTYRFLSVFWRDFWPRFDAPVQRPPPLLGHLAQERFGDQFDPAAGVVRFVRPQRLRADLAELPSGRMADPHISHFVALNPRYAEGDELVCLTELGADNLTAAGRRMLVSTRDEPVVHPG